MKRRLASQKVRAGLLQSPSVVVRVDPGKGVLT